LSFRLSVLVFGCLLAAPVWADGPEGQSWPEQLRHRNARYAQLDRSYDHEGDARERLLADFITRRSLDPLGDREEERRARASRHVPPLATTYAEIARADDRSGDDREAVLARLPKARLNAELRRFRDLQGDMEEFTRWQVDRIRHGPLRWQRTSDGTVVAHELENEARRRFIEERGVDREDAARDRDARREQRDEARDFERSEQLHERRFLDDRLFDRAERETERDEERAERDAERDEERAEDQIDRELDKLEDDTDRDLDKLEDDTDRDLERDEARLEREEERDVERQIQQEEENTLDLE
jgi:hypothetical protein